MGTSTILLHGVGSVDRRVYLKALRIVNQDRVVYIRPSSSGFVAVVRGDSGELYRVSIERGLARCTCPHNSIHGRTCKHIVAVLIRLRSLLRRNLPPHDRSSG